MTSAVQRADQEEQNVGGGAVVGVMAALAWLPRLLGLHIAWLVLTLAGGIVLGAGPASVALVAELEDRRDHPADLRATAARIWARFRAELTSATIAVGPFALIAAAAGANLLFALAGAAPAWFVPYGLAPAAALLLWAVPASQHAVALRVVRPEARLVDLWRAAAAAPVLLPLATLGWWVTISSVAAASAVIVPLGAILGVGLVLATTWALLVRVWHGRIEEAAARAAG